MAGGSARSRVAGSVELKSMRLITHPIIILMLVGILARLAVAGAIARRGLAGKYPAVMLYLVAGAARSSWLIWCGVHSPTGYHDAWISTQALPIILTTLLVWQLHWIMAEHFRGVRRFAAVLVAVYFGIGVGVAILTAGLGQPPWNAQAAAPIAIQRHFMLGALLVLALSRHYWYASPTTELRRNVRLLVDSLFLALAVEWLALVVIRGLPIGTLVWVAEYAIAAVPVALAVAWWHLRPSGEAWTRPEAILAGSTAAADAEIRRIRERMGE